MGVSHKREMHTIFRPQNYNKMMPKRCIISKKAIYNHHFLMFFSEKHHQKNQQAPNFFRIRDSKGTLGTEYATPA